MVRFSCFASPIHYYKTKKFVQRSAEAMEKTSHDSSRDQAPKVSYNSPSSNLLQSSHDNNPSKTSQEQITSSPSIECWKSEEMNSSEDNKEVCQTIHIKRSQSLGSGLDREAQVSFVVEEDEIDQDLSCDDDSHEKNFKRMFNAFDHNEAVETFDHQDSEVYLLEQFTEPCLVESLQTNDDLVHDKSIFSIGDPQQMEMEVQEDFDKQLSAKHVDDSGYHTPDAPDTIGRIVKSCSLPDLRGSKTSPVEDFPEHGFMGPRSKSFEGLSGIDARKREFLIHEDGSCSRSTIYESKGVPLSRTSPLHGTSSIYQEATHEDCGLSYPSGGSYEVEDEERVHISRSEKHACESQFGDGNSPLHGTCSIYQEATHEDCGLSYPSGGSYEVENEERVHISRSEKHACESHFGDGYDSHNFTGFTTDWALTEMTGVDVGANLQHESSVHRWAGLSNREFNIKRIEHWINNIDLQNDSPVQEVGECSSSTHKISRDSSLMGGVVSTKSDARLTPGMELANRYISSLTALSTSAQMTNLGLAGVPILSAYVGLRVLNLSGNAIVRITPGALPRGLHVLNLSKNNISTIEGLRELTRLRVLDLSYNRIFRIGHGLASCSSLKEFYLAGNKISDVEGLHRLLKLIVLDLRFNKISTAKCLGQLAANYSSLQAINLEGNPAQRNVGDEQLKKYLVGLLPHLVYFNRQTIKNSSLKEVADRPARSVTAYQFDRGLRSEHKLSRRGSHGSSIHRSNHGRSSQAVGSPKLSRGRHGGLPSSRLRATHHQLDTGTKRSNLHSRHSIHRSRSEGSLLRFES